MRGKLVLPSMSEGEASTAKCEREGKFVQPSMSEEKLVQPSMSEGKLAQPSVGEEKLVHQE